MGGRGAQAQALAKNGAAVFLALYFTENSNAVMAPKSKGVAHGILNFIIYGIFQNNVQICC